MWGFFIFCSFNFFYVLGIFIVVNIWFQKEHNYTAPSLGGLSVITVFLQV